MAQRLSAKANEIQPAGRWITEKLFAEIHNLHPQTLCNWRLYDRRAGRRQAELGYPQYRYFGKAVRYWLPTSAMPERAA